MRKIKALFYVFYNSLTSLDYYKDVIKTNLNFSMKYFVFLALAASIFAAIPIVKVIPQIREGINSIFTQSLQAFPGDLIITAKDGNLSINKPEPYIVPIPKSTKDEYFTSDKYRQQFGDQEAPENAMVFDSDGTIDDLENYKTLILVNKSNILVKNRNKIEVYPLRDIPDGEFTKQDLEDLANKIRPYTKYVPYAFFGVAFIFIVFYQFAFRLLYLLLVGAILMVVGKGNGLALSFEKYYQIGIHTLTLPLIIEVISDLFEYPIPLPIWFFVLNVAFGIFAVFRIKEGSRIQPTQPQVQPQVPQNPETTTQA